MRQEVAPYAQQVHDLVYRWHQNYRALYDNARHILDHVDDPESQEAYTVDQRRHLKQEYSRAIAAPLPTFEDLIALDQSDRMGDYRHPLECVRLPRPF